MKPEVILLFVVLTVCVCCASLSASTYYISQSTGKDSWPGTQDKPWKTLWKASQMTYEPGDQIFLKRGDAWSDEADPGKCELVLKGEANIRNQDWITVGAYGTGNRPHITHPSKDSTSGLLNWSDVIKWAEEHPGTGFDQYLDRTYIRIAIRIVGNGWKIHGLEISQAEMGIANYLNPGDGYWIEDIYMHDMCGLIWPKHPDYNTRQALLGANPLTFGAIDMAGSNVTVKDCTIIRNYDPLFIGGDGIHGTFQNALFENLYISHMIGGGTAYISGNDITVKNCTILHGEHGDCTLDPDTLEHTLTPNNWFQGCWFGPDSFDICASTNYVIDNCEIAYVSAGSGPEPEDEGCDQAPISIQGENVNVQVKNSFLHDCMHGTFGFHFGIGIFKQIGTRIENNTIYRNSLAHLDGSIILFGDAMDPSWYEPWSTSDITFLNNRIYQDVASGQRLMAYIDGNPDNVWDHFTDPKCFYDSPDGQYTFPEPPAPDANIIVTGAYDNHVPAPPAISATNIASTSYPGFHYGFSSEAEGHEAGNLIDGDYGTSWVPEAPYDQQYVSFGWDSPQAVDRIRIFDRPEVGQCSRSMRIHFSDGTDYYVQGGILDNGAMREILFDTPKSITYMTLWFTRWEGAPGLSEVRVYTNSHTPPRVEDADAGEFTCDFEGAALGALMGTAGGPSAERNNINWSNADWAVMEESPGGNKCAFLNFQPMVWTWEPGQTPVERATRIFYLPKGKKLKSIDISTPPPSAFKSPCPQECKTGFKVAVSQLGADSAIVVTDADGQWHRNMQMKWPAGPPKSNIVIVSVVAMGSPDGYGVHTVAFDNIVYGD